jgi:uncharacterized protein (TIGR02145 family)
MNKFRVPQILTVFFLVLTNSCVDSSKVPVVQTTKITAVDATTATCWGNVPSNPGSDISERGVCWNTASNPTIKNSKATTTAGTGNFSVGMSGLTMGTKYYVRCYATNKSGTAYGAELTITTLFEDYDGNTCETITIGEQVWMAENLKVTRYRDGTKITNVTDPTAWSSLTTGAHCSYNSILVNEKTYKYLYNWYAVNNSKYIAPTGWHVPTQAEWTTLINYLGGASVAGDILKETGNTHWTGTYTGATNTSTFTALPGGCVGIENGVYGFYGIGTNGYWWSATAVDSNNAYSWSLSNNSAEAVTTSSAKQSGFSIRLVKD